MRALFLLAIALGFGGTLAAAHWVPWISHPRLPSQTTVVANGGRAEQFLIRLPADRIAATDAKAGGLRSAGADSATSRNHHRPRRRHTVIAVSPVPGGDAHDLTR